MYVRTLPPRSKTGTTRYECGECGTSHPSFDGADYCCFEKKKPAGVDLQKTQIGGDHYLKPVQPWDLMKVMDSSGNAFVDACRCNVIKYSFRKKTDMVEDLKKARHYLDAAIGVLEKQ